MPLTPPEHEHSAAIDEAAAWMVADLHYQFTRPLVPYLKATFGLTTTEAIEACREAQRLRDQGGANAAS